MAFSGNFMCTSFKKELMTATHNFTNSSGNTFKLALYTNSASFNAATTGRLKRDSYRDGEPRMDL